jgi:hypothetical protein
VPWRACVRVVNAWSSTHHIEKEREREREELGLIAGGVGGGQGGATTNLVPGGGIATGEVDEVELDEETEEASVFELLGQFCLEDVAVFFGLVELQQDARGKHPTQLFCCRVARRPRMRQQAHEQLLQLNSPVHDTTNDTTNDTTHRAAG